jgi:hypothetical protein
LREQGTEDECSLAETEQHEDGDYPLPWVYLMVLAVKVVKQLKLSLYQIVDASVSCEVRTPSTCKRVKLSLYQTVDACVSCKVRTPSTCKRVKLSLYQTVEACVSCEVRTPSTCKRVKLSDRKSTRLNSSHAT